MLTLLELFDFQIAQYKSFCIGDPKRLNVKSKTSLETILMHQESKFGIFIRANLQRSKNLRNQLQGRNFLVFQLQMKNKAPESRSHFLCTNAPGKNKKRPQQPPNTKEQGTSTTKQFNHKIPQCLHLLSLPYKRQ